MADITLSVMDTSLPTVGTTNALDAAMPLGKRNWLDYQNPEYKQWSKKWQYADDHYSGAIIDPLKLPVYLIKRQIGESIDSWEERARLVDFTNHMATVIDSIIGILMAKEDDATRKFSDDPENPTAGLGSASDPSTTIGRLYLDADGQGTGFLTIFKQLAIQLCVTHKAWMMIDSPNGNPRVQLLQPECVTNWMYDKEDGGLSEVLVRVDSDTRTSLQDEPKGDCEYIHYTRQGWQRWKTVEGKPVALTGDGNEGAYAFVDRMDRPCLPIYECVLPVRRPVGWILAHKQNTIFNLESGRDFLLWIANFPKLMVAAGDELYLKILDGLRNGINVIQEDTSITKNHHYEAPPTDSANIATEVLKRKVEEFYITAFREYSNSARQRTATEARQDMASGVGAFLQMVKSALDDAENNAYHRIEQIEFPGDSSKWFHAQVARSSDFAPTDVSDMIEKMGSRYFQAGNPIPLGRSAQVAIAKSIAGWEGVDVDEDEIASAIDIAQLKSMFQILPDFQMPPDAQARLALKVLTAMGIVKDDDGDDSDDPNTLDAKTLLADLLKNAETEANNKQAMKDALAKPHTPVGGATGKQPPGSQEEDQNAPDSSY